MGMILILSRKGDKILLCPLAAVPFNSSVFYPSLKGKFSFYFLLNGRDSLFTVVRCEIKCFECTVIIAFSTQLKAGPNSANGSLQCLCTHLSAFGGDLLVAPNPIDFDKVWDAFSNLLETKNFVVIGTVCAIFGLYTIAVVFARRADRSDSQKVSNVYFIASPNNGRHYNSVS